MKWIAYAKAHVEGDDYFFSYSFTIPEDLYIDLWDTADHNLPIRKCKRYDEVLKYAQIAINYRKLCGFDLYYRDKRENESDEDYWEFLKEHNSIRKDVNADLKYIRIFDPNLEKEFIDLCQSLPYTIDCLGKKKKYYYIYFNREIYEWSIDYYDEEDIKVSRIHGYVSDEKFVKYLNGENSIYPPFEEIIEDLKNNKIEYYLKDIT
jgi:hypothetical protein